MECHSELLCFCFQHTSRCCLELLLVGFCRFSCCFDVLFVFVGDPNPRGGADQNTVWILGADHTVHEFSKRSHGLGSTRGKLYKTRIKMCRHLYRPIHSRLLVHNIDRVKTRQKAHGKGEDKQTTVIRSTLPLNGHYAHGSFETQSENSDHLRHSHVIV